MTNQTPKLTNSLVCSIKKAGYKLFTLAMFYKE